VIEMDQNSDASDRRINSVSRDKLSRLRRRSRQARARVHRSSDQALKDTAHLLRQVGTRKSNEVEDESPRA